MSDTNNNPPISTTTITPTPATTNETRIPFRRVYMSMTIPMIGRIHVETEYEPIQDNTTDNTNTANGENTSNNNPNASSRPTLSEILPMMMLMNSLAGSFFGPALSLHHPAFANLTPEQIAAFMQGGGNKPKPAASAEVVECLPRIKIQPNQEIHTCTICQDEMEVDQIAIRIPCGHLYHSDCILPWLKEHNNCPNDRYELLTDDEEYNKNVVLKQAPVKPANANNTPAESTTTPTTKDTDVEMSPIPNEPISNADSSSNSDQMNDISNWSAESNNTTNPPTILPPEVELIVEELKRQVSVKQASKDVGDIDMQLDGSHQITEQITTNINNTDSSNEGDSSSIHNGEFVLRNSIKRKRENEESAVTIEDITGHEEEYD